MSNTIKYSESTEQRALNKGNWYIGTGDVNKGPSDVTGFYAGVEPPPLGYTIYSRRPDNLPTIFVAQNDQELIFLTNQISENKFTTLNECLEYYSSQDDKILANKSYQEVITDGLILNLDASYIPSYPKTGTTWYDTSPNYYNATLTNGPTYTGGSINFNGSNEYVITDTTDFTANGNFSYEVFCKSDQYVNEGIILGNKDYWLNGGQGAAIGNQNNTQNVFAYVVTSENIYSIDTGIGPTFNWTHFVLTKTGSLIEVFVNGIKLETTVTISGTISDLYNYFLIGNQNWKGNIVSVRVYDRPLNQSEVYNNYKFSKTNFLVNDFVQRINDDGGSLSVTNVSDIENGVVNLIPESSLLLPSSAGSDGTLYSIIPDNGNGDFSVVRNGNATYFDKEGKIQVVGSNTPRFEYDPLTGEYKGLLCESEITNLISYTNQPNNLSILGYQYEELTDERFGKIYKIKEYEGYSGSHHFFSQTLQGISSWVNGLRLRYVFAKQGEGNRYLQVSPRTNGWNGVIFNLNTGQIASQLANYRAFIRDIGDGWYICGFTDYAFNIPTSTQQNFSVSIIPTVNRNSVGHQYENQSGTYIYACLPMAYIGENYVNPILSDGGSVTRSADNIKIENNQEIFGQTEGTIFFEFHGFGRTVSLSIGGLIFSVAESSKIAYTYNNQERRLYKNGRLIDSVSGNYSYGTLNSIYLN